MLDFLSENLQAVLAVLYLIERLFAVRGEWRSTAIQMAKAIQSGYPKSEMREQPNMLVDIILDDKVEPKEEKRVSKGKRILDGAVKLLPLVSRFIK